MISIIYLLFYDDLLLVPFILGTGSKSGLTNCNQPDRVWPVPVPYNAQGNVEEVVDNLRIEAE